MDWSKKTNAYKIALDRDGLVSNEDLFTIYQAIIKAVGRPACKLPLSNVGKMLRYANELLKKAESRKRTPYDGALAIVEFALCEFYFTRWEQKQ